MTAVKLILALGASLSLAACGDMQIASRNAPALDPQPSAVTPNMQAFAATEDGTGLLFDAAAAGSPPDPNRPQLDVRVGGIEVVVPNSLEVSEAKNLYLPRADIVWRDDPIGDRHAQVRTIFEEAFAAGTGDLDGATPVSLYVQVMRFHSLTERARASIGGVHLIKFGLALRDLTNGELIGAPRIIEADLLAYGGREAEAAEAVGETQKKRITDHLAQVIAEELTAPDGSTNQNLGFIQAMQRF